MNFNQTPHPQIEDHHHIQDLINRQDKRVKERNRHRDRIKNLEERDEEIEKANRFVLHNFWCDKCKKDFQASSIKQIEEDWNAEQRIAFYKTKCFNGHWCIRLITDRFKDGFHVKSRLLALDRGNHFNDIVQSHEENYNLLYGKK
jgi:hypothetical protein